MDIDNLLNKEQREACKSESRHLRIVAGAGTGKTRTLTYRVAYLIEKGVSPFSIVCITFTKKVATEMRERVEKIMKDDGISLYNPPFISTFHGFCARFLRVEIGSFGTFNTHFTIADDSDQGEIYKDIFKTMAKGDSKDFRRDIANKISSLKTDGIYPERVVASDVPPKASYTFDELVHVYSQYQEILERQNMLDFDDLLYYTYFIMKNHPEIRKRWSNKFSHILVDEFQDTNIIQYELLKLFLGPDTSLTVVGDPDQTIYTWRGAKNEIIKSLLERDFPDLDTVILDKNYRSTQNILDHANKLIVFNKDRVKKDLVAASGTIGNQVHYINAEDEDRQGFMVASRIRRLVEGEQYSYNDIAIIYRSNFLSRVLEKHLVNFAIPYTIYGDVKFYDRAEVKDALAYIKMYVNKDDISFKRILKSPRKGIGDTTLSNANKLVEDGIAESLFDAFRYHRDKLKIKSASAHALDDFYKAYDKFEKEANSSIDAGETVSAVRTYLNDAGFIEYIRKVDSDEETKDTVGRRDANVRMNNVLSLFEAMQKFMENDYFEDGQPRKAELVDYLLDVTLQSYQDDMNGTNGVSLMTGHVSKGLEFPVVFLCGADELLFPSRHSIEDDNIEEERRLFFVSMTRAMKELYIYSYDGVLFGSYSLSPSRFIKEAGFSRAENARTVSPRPTPYSQNRQTRTFSFSNSYRKPTSLFNPEQISSLNKIGRETRVSGEKYSVGDKIMHVSFGVGDVVETDPKGDWIAVVFPEVGRKKLKTGMKAYRKIVEDK